MKVSLRRTEDGKMMEHHFLNEAHACAWLKTDKGNNERFTVCLVNVSHCGPDVLGGYFKERETEVVEEMTVDEFIDRALDMQDEKKGKNGTDNPKAP